MSISRLYCLQFIIKSLVKVIFIFLVMITVKPLLQEDIDIIFCQVQAVRMVKAKATLKLHRRLNQFQLIFLYLRVTDYTKGSYSNPFPYSLLRFIIFHSFIWCSCACIRWWWYFKNIAYRWHCLRLTLPPASIQANDCANHWLCCDCAVRMWVYIVSEIVVSAKFKGHSQSLHWLA